MLRSLLIVMTTLHIRNTSAMWQHLTSRSPAERFFHKVKDLWEKVTFERHMFITFKNMQEEQTTVTARVISKPDWGDYGRGKSLTFKVSMGGQDLWFRWEDGKDVPKMTFDDISLLDRVKVEHWLLDEKHPNVKAFVPEKGPENKKAQKNASEGPQVQDEVEVQDEVGNSFYQELRLMWKQVSADCQMFITFRYQDSQVDKRVKAAVVGSPVMIGGVLTFDVMVSGQVLEFRYRMGTSIQALIRKSDSSPVYLHDVRGMLDRCAGCPGQCVTTEGSITLWYRATDESGGVSRVDDGGCQESPCGDAKLDAGDVVDGQSDGGFGVYREYTS